MNLRPPNEATHSNWWEEIGVWKSENGGKVTKIPFFQSSSNIFYQVEIKDIVWPGEALKPPEGVPEKRFLSITFLEEDPYIMLNSPTTCTGATKGTICQIVPDWDLEGVNITEEVTNPNSTKFKCCSGFCVDLIRKFSVDLAFDYALKRVKDGQWGGIVNGSWNGLVAELINHETDLVMTSLKINSS